jgi:predicted N-acyltransferase
MILGKEVKVFRSIDEVGQIVDSISNDPFFTYGYFKTLETQKTQKISPIYIVIYEGKKLVAFAPFFLDLIEKHSQNFFALLLNSTKILGYNLNSQLMCYSPRCYRCKILFSEEINRKLILNMLCKKIDSICTEKKILKSQFAFVSEFDDDLFDSFHNYGYQKIIGMTTCYLDIKWNNFDDYILSLKSKARTNVRREIKKCIENGITIQEAELGNLTEKLDELYNNLFLKYNKNAIKIFDSDFFNKLNLYAKDKTKLFIAKKNGEIIGFSLSLCHKDVMDVVWVGFNYDSQSKTDFSYFNLTYYVPIRWGIENGIKKMYYRLTMEKIKLDRGCNLETTFFFVKYHGNFLNTIYTKIVKNSVLNRFISRLL